MKADNDESIAFNQADPQKARFEVWREQNLGSEDPDDLISIARISGRLALEKICCGEPAKFFKDGSVVPTKLLSSAIKGVDLNQNILLFKGPVKPS